MDAATSHYLKQRFNCFVSRSTNGWKVPLLVVFRYFSTGPWGALFGLQFLGLSDESFRFWLICLRPTADYLMLTDGRTAQDLRGT